MADREFNATRRRVMKRYAIFGASGLGREIVPVLRQQLEAFESAPWEIAFVDDRPPAAQLNGHRVYTYAEWLDSPSTERKLVIGIADGVSRERIANRCEADSIDFFELRASNTVVMDNVQIGVGAVLSPFVTVTSNVQIGRHFHANIYSYVAHDCVIGDFVTFAPSVHCNGNVVVEDHVYVGTGAIVRQGRPGKPLVIGRGAVVGMGAVVTKSVAPGTTVVGNPARIMKAKSE